MFFIQVLNIIHQNNMSETKVVMSPEKSDSELTFNSEHSWMVQCLSLATLGLLTYLHVAPVVAHTI